MPFETVTGFFEGGFYDAAEIYRDFALNSALKVQRKEFTEWLNEPPVVVIYPVRGEKDTGDVSPNCYYPYTNALPYLEKIKERIGERLLVMLCHWEGSAPWCPPFVWPPYGDAENFKEFFNKLHENGDLTGLYCSGISWTETSVYTDYSEKGRLSAQRLKETMCTAPDGGLPYAIICNEWLRNGYEMCPYTQSAKEIMKEAAGDMVRNGNADYIQMFDQNLGGNSSYCYSSEHGHPRTPGVWQTKAMRKMIELLSSNNCVFGCESAAAEGFMDLLPFNDGRNYMGFCIGTPVPAYAYVYHEYINNFMGNQNTTMTYLDAAENPENLLYRLGHFFAQGEALCIVLKDGGKINWDWGTPWSQPDPEQEEVFALLRNLVDWRKGNLKEELIFGKMEKAFDINCEKYRIKRKDGRVIAYPSVITRAWSTKIMRSQIFVNPFPRENKVSFTEISGRLIKTPFGNAEDFLGDKFVLPPFSVYKLVF